MLQQNVALIVVEFSSDLLALLGGGRIQVKGCHGDSCVPHLARLLLEQFYRKIKVTAPEGADC